MNEEEALRIIQEYYLDAEYYFAENDCYPDNYDEDFYEALSIAMSILKDKCKQIK